MTISTLLNTFPWIPLIVVVFIFAVLACYSLLKGGKGEIPINLKNPDLDKRRADVGKMESRMMPRE